MKSINKRFTRHEEVADIFVIDDNGTILGRPILTMRMDNCIRMIVEFKITGYKKHEVIV